MMDSAMEVKIHNILTDYGLPFAEEYEFPDLMTKSGKHLRFDFCVFDDDGQIDFLIEAQGKQHYSAVPVFGGSKGLQKQKYNDLQKRNYCLNHNLKLIAIPYWDEDEISYEYIMQAAGY